MQSQNPRSLVPNQVPHTNTTHTTTATTNTNTNTNTNSNTNSNSNMNTGTNPRHQHPSQAQHNPSSKPPGQRHAHPPSKTNTNTNTNTATNPNPNTNTATNPNTNTATNPNANTSAAAKWVPHEERLRKAWRAIGNHIVHCMVKADALSRIPKDAPSQETAAKKRELDDAVKLFLRNRRDYHLLLSKIEAKLTGKAEEMESLETYVRTQPRIGGRKRKR